MKAVFVSIARKAFCIGVVVGAFGLGLAAVSKPSVAASCSVARSSLHQRVHDPASRGPEVLRNFTVRTRNTYGLDLQEESARHARESAAERACLQAQAAEATPTQVPDAPAATASR